METNKTYRSETTGNWVKICPKDEGVYKIIRGFKGELVAQGFWIERTKTKRGAVIVAQDWIKED